MRARRVLALLVIGVAACAVLGPPTLAPGADPEAGRRVFASKQCARCHLPRGEQGRGPALEEIRRPQGEMELAGRLWNHLPAMLVSIAGQSLVWPAISVTEMGDLMAYLQAGARRDPEPDLAKGQMTLVRKGCLKCHTLRREGGPVKPDLAERRADYESGPAWAATMWQHTPRMEEVARRQGVPYPRFSGDEMANLVGLLRSAANP
jgi:cytochrome c2